MATATLGLRGTYDRDLLRRLHRLSYNPTGILHYLEELALGMGPRPLAAGEILLFIAGGKIQEVMPDLVLPEDGDLTFAWERPLALTPGAPDLRSPTPFQARIVRGVMRVLPALDAARANCRLVVRVVHDAHDPAGTDPQLTIVYRSKYQVPLLARKAS